MKAIKARQTLVFDLRALRDNQVPDERNQTIPVNATRGKIVWSVRGRNSLALLGRSEQVDLRKGISSSYACFMCCPNSFRYSRISPIGFGLKIDNFTSVRGVERDQTCYGGLTPEYYWGDTWSVDNSSIASIDGTGDAADVTGVSVGTVTVTGQWEVFTYSFEHDIDGPYCVESSDMTDPSGPVDVLNLTWTTPGGVGEHGGGVPIPTGTPPAGSLAYVNSTTITATGTPDGGTYSWSTASNKVTLSNTTSATVTVTAVSESENTGDVTITVTYTKDGSSVSVDIPFTVQRPSSMAFISSGAGTADDCDAGNGTGSKKDIVWQVRDQRDNPIKFRLPIFDTMTNNTPNTCFLPAQGEGTAPGKGTGNGGQWGHKYRLCSTACNNGGSCTVGGTQKYFVQGYEISLSYTMTCSSITVGGH